MSAAPFPGARIASLAPLPDGRALHEITLSGQGLTVRLLTLGSILRDLRLEGLDLPLTPGASDPADYLGPLRHAGALVGPVANRIGGAMITPGGIPRPVPANEWANCLHGGAQGFQVQSWQIADAGPAHLELRLALADGEDGWPGNREIRARWTLPAPGTLALELTAQSDAPTWLAPAQHSYWRLGPGPDIAGHILTVPAARYTEVDAGKIPTGALLATAGTPFDFQRGAPVGPGAARIDHNLCLADRRGALRQVARLTGPSARMELFSTEPGLQVYDAAHFGKIEARGPGGETLAAHAGLALEPQLWPDAGKHAGWQGPELSPGETYRQETRWRFERLPA